jgi:hypothetical protein
MIRRRCANSWTPGWYPAVARLVTDHADAKRAVGEAAEEQRQVTALRAAVDGASYDLESIAYVALVG